MHSTLFSACILKHCSEAVGVHEPTSTKLCELLTQYTTAEACELLEIYASQTAGFTFRRA